MDYTDLEVWIESRKLANLAYESTRNFPKEELFALANQIRRCAVSIPSNIAEGYGRNTDKSFSHFLDIARGSLFEIETQLIIAKELGFITNLELFQELLNQIEEESKMINAFSKTLKANH